MEVFFNNTLQRVRFINFVLWLTIPLNLWPAFGYGQAPKLSFKHLGYQQGLSNSVIECIIEDNRGYMWFGTRDGLNRFDGHEITTFRHIQGDTTSINGNYITALYEDSRRRLWVGTLNGLNRFDPYTDEFIHLQAGDNDPGSLAGNTVTSICEDSSRRLWIATNDGLSLLDENSRRFTSFRPTEWFPEYGGNDRINAICEGIDGRIWAATNKGLLFLDPQQTAFVKSTSQPSLGNVLIKFIVRQNNDLWLGTQNSGLYRVDLRTATAKHFQNDEKSDSSLSGNMIESLFLDKKGNIWVGTINCGLNLFNPASDCWYHYNEEPESQQGLSNRTVSAIFEDKVGNFWVGTHRGGVNLYSPFGEKFGLYTKKLTGHSLSDNDVIAFGEDRKGNIWVGTNGGGLNYFDRRRNSFAYYRFDPNKPHSISSDAIMNIVTDSHNELWVSTWGGGLNRMVKNGSFIRYTNSVVDSNSISSNYVQSTLEDSHGNFWVATYYGGLNLLDRRTGRFHRVSTDPSGQTAVRGNNIVSMAEDKTGKLWFGTDDGGLNCYDPVRQHFFHYFNDQASTTDLRVIFIDKQGRLWVGQEGLYLFDPSKNSFSLYTRRGGLAHEFIKGIEEDTANNFWISTSRGLIRFDPADSSFSTYNTSDGLQGLEFYTNSCMQTHDGEMFFGGADGFNCFYPSQIRINHYVPPVYITELRVFNEKIHPGDSTGILESDISLTQTIELSYKQSSIAFTFSALNYTNSENNRYAYKLEGFDKNWHFTNTENKTNYTNLDFGDYVFHVRACNNDGIWNDKGASIRIRIRPPFWKTSWFLFLVSMVMVGSGYAIYLRKRQRQLKKMEARKQQELVQMQLQFFTNISHELRTPLMLIMGPAERLLKEEATPIAMKQYRSIHRNAGRLLYLINELMDYRKLQAGALKLQTVPGNLSNFLEEIAAEFYEWADRKNIHFVVRPDKVRSDSWYDRQVSEKIVLNLLSNAFKYTPSGGTIEIDVLDSLSGFKPSFANEMFLLNDYRAQRYKYIRIRDNGTGISADSIQHIFERYFRVSEYHLGSGIGLAFVRSLTALHKGDIFVYSERERGTEIIVGIPADEASYLPEEKWANQPTENRTRLESLHNRYEGEFSASEDTPEAHPVRRRPLTRHVLVTDDNEELRHFIKDCLIPHYQVSEAADGAEGLRKAKSSPPDLIISDVMMPVMNGNEFCKAIRQDIDTSHIPFIMLTAKDANPAKVEGAEAGADFYFSKPVNVEFLLLSIRNIFDQQQKLRDHYVKDYQADARELLQSGKDKEFLDELLAIIDSQLMNPDLDIEYVCRKVNMSRSKLYEKIKAITGQATGDFIRTIRLKKAVDIMVHEDVSLMEIACRVGIQTQSYFTKAFKKQYGKTPMQFMQDLVKK
jgi:ligand-binding sensor domain-containing protein/signal transduction histidine kinase/DNA-binding NarL/FixJ family response regulator